MTNHVEPERATQRGPRRDGRIARIAYAAVAVTTAAVILLGSFI